MTAGACTIVSADQIYYIQDPADNICPKSDGYFTAVKGTVFD